MRPFPVLSLIVPRVAFGENWRKIFVECVAALLLNLSRFRRIFIAMEAVQSGFFHRRDLS
jgi:hypothetical protein